MKNLPIIIKALEKQKAKLDATIVDNNNMLIKKQDVISKMTQYQKEYCDVKFQLSDRVPVLSMNRKLFMDKIGDIIKRTEKDIVLMEERKKSLFEERKVIENKLEMMRALWSRVVMKQTFLVLKSEEAMIDDLIGSRHAVK